jgi:jagged-1
LFGGTCHHIGGEQFSCTCPEGLSGARCEIVEHPCAPVPCKNGATCTVKESAAKDKNATRAEYKPRQFRGMSSMGAPVSVRPIAVNDSFSLTAAKTEADYVCACPPGFDGERCEQSK